MVPIERRGDDNGALVVEGWGLLPHWGVSAALFLTSAALLILEVSLTRFFSYTIWYHFAYLTISVALLGFGSSGAIVAAFPRLLARYGERFLIGTLVAAAVLAAGGLAVLAQHPMEIENLLRKPLHFSLSLLVYYVVVGAPFLLAGFSVSVPFAAYPRLMGRLYFWDLSGAAVGCAAVVALIGLTSVPSAVFIAAALMVLAAASLAAAGKRRPLGIALGAAAVAMLTVAGPAGERLPIRITSSKNLSPLMLDGPGTPAFDARSDKFSKWTALSRVDSFGWATPTNASFWSGIGLSPNWNGFKPDVAHIMYDGGNGSDVYTFHGDIAGEFQMLEHHLLRLPYLVLDHPDVLAIGVGGGIDLFNAVKQGAHHVTGAELQPETVNLLSNRLRAFTGDFFHRDDVTLVASEGRHFVRKSNQLFDLVQITAVDTFAAQATGAYVLAESYLYTVEAMEDYLRHLTSDGLVTTVIGDLVIDQELPPLACRLALIGYRALQRQGVADPSSHIVVVGLIPKGSYAQNESVMVKKAPFTPAELERIRTFSAENGFTVLYAPGPGSYPLATVLGADETARQNQMDASWFNWEATYDANPFFYNVGKWTRLSESKSPNFIMPGSYMGQLVLVLMLVQSTVLGAALIVFPLLRGARAGLAIPRVASYLAYFLALGIGFMFIEISFVQTFVLFLGSPTYALSVTIFALLLFSALGSLLSGRFADRPEWMLRRLSLAIAVLVGLYAFGLSSLFDAALSLDIGARIAIAITAQMPIGLTLGMFMPLGVACVAREHPRLVPWAWGINGVGSVVGTTLAVLVAMAAGFRIVALCAAGLYLVGTELLLRSRPSSDS